MGGAPRAVSTRLLHEVDGWPRRRSQGRLEGKRTVGDGEHARAVPYGDGEGHDEQGAPLPAPARSPRPVMATRGPNDFEGRVAIVTGASRGLGRAAALRLYE